MGMQLTVNGAKTFCYTGGKPFDAAKPTVVFIHGVLNDHSVWILQTRYFAHHGWNVLALDLPGHCKSEGEPPPTVEEAADFVLALLDAAGVEKARPGGPQLRLAGRPGGRRARAGRTHLALVGTAYPMKVSPALLENSQHQPMKAIDMVNVYSHSMMAPPPSSLGPGTWLHGGSRALMRRVLASNPRVNVFHRGFAGLRQLCGRRGGDRQVACPVLFLLGRNDAMTPPKAAHLLQQQAKNAARPWWSRPATR